MKKHSPNPPDTSPDSTTETPDLSNLSNTTEPAISARLRNPNHLDPVSHVFTIRPDIDTPSLLIHASETLASLNVMSTDLACELESSRRNIALAIQQLAVLAQLLVNRALDNIAPLDEAEA
ncbi:hypothetical protein KW841_24920 [Pseudomonas sp. PDM28]|uniref:DUF6124 family protein n=1 Tax=Pseudomonas sp. PDM28 TaxID=2854770 RepID=UPI001C43C4D9|nr:DUF6124 family protein [Pseudomonas sp. PDM28]MBV7555595.1 hypothetical protein [Pseudomonas sp. PDM28]